ncbi:dynamin protein [Plasmodium falciparum IGH-CR14]|uniref:Dynamin protein n=1 Tax=Plasmodium falciparum IGH-CR14 TaxID=580059 RepID=A0A0L1IBM6_PLAFA|nr:dynamin protein [Plasmodium falciparum IGH-CR14]
METSMYNNLRKLINVIDELRDIGLQKYINLPRICVVGTQSSGKSSVLESIVGMDFLPRGEGIVTRRPIEFRLIHIKEDSEIKYWAVFENEKNKKYTDFNEVREQINRLTDEIAGKNKGIIDEPIVLNIYSIKCPDLSLIDLPGITRVPLKNSDQTDDIERLTRDMALRYVKDPRTIILAVLPANADMSTSDALQIARKVDPKGLRTIGVITKIDLMDKGADASVVNRSTADIKKGKTISQALKDELEFFQKHPVYKKLPPALYGTNSLTDKLTKVLLRHIKNFLPDIKIEINDKIRYINDKLYELGTNVPLDATKKTQLLWSMITDYCEIFKNTLKGKYDKREEIVSWFPITTPFEFLIFPHLKKINAPVFNCLDRSKEKENTQIILENYIDAETNYLFTNDASYLIEHGSIINAADDEHNENHNNTTNINNNNNNNNSSSYDYGIQHRNQNKRQQSNISNSNQDTLLSTSSKYYSNMMSDQEYNITGKAAKFVTSAQKSVMNIWNTKEKKKTRYNAQFIQEIRRRLDCYFNIVLRNVRDSVPKMIGYFLIRKLQEKMQFELYSDLNSEQKLYDLLNEPPNVVKEREHLNNQLEILKKANQVLLKDPNITSINLDLFDANYEQDLMDYQKSLKNTNQFNQSSKHNPNMSQGSSANMSMYLNDGSSSMSKRNPMMHNRNMSPSSMNTNMMKQTNMLGQKMGNSPSSYMQQGHMNDSKGKHLFEKEPMKKKVIKNVNYNPLFD